MPRRVIFAALLLAAVCTVAAPAAAVELQGHRGARGLLPENTLPGFERALKLGVDVLELDVGVTRDGAVVISHDRALNPDIARLGEDWISAPKLIHAMTRAELKAYDVGRARPGGKVARRFPKQQAVDGTPVPLLRDLFDRVTAEGNSSIRFNIETKISPNHPADTIGPKGFAEAVVNVVKSHEMISRTTIQSFDWRTLRVVNDLAPAIRTVCLTAQQRWLDNVGRGLNGASPWLAGLDADDFPNVPALVKAAGCAIWSPYWRDISAAAVRVAHDLGLKVVVWTVNDAETMRAIIKLGVDGIITDYPDIGRSVLPR